LLHCHVCRQDNPAGARFCNACGSPLDGEARPLREERKVVTVNGDGGFLMNVQELETAVRLGTAVERARLRQRSGMTPDGS
jgi:TPP-dependent 2-oxoacid decarboxylase